MREHRQEKTNGSFSMQTLLQLIRAAGSILGIITIIIGVVYATRIFAVVLDILLSPAAFQIQLDKWITAVGGEQLDIAIGETTVHGANIAAISVLGCGVLILAWIAIAMIRAGAKTVSWTLSDREAVKKILIHAFGPEHKKPNTK